MRLKLFNGTNLALSLNVLGGGYDAETLRCTLIIQNSEGDQVGTVSYDVAEAHRVARLLTAGTPNVTKVPGVLEDDARGDGERDAQGRVVSVSRA